MKAEEQKAISEFLNDLENNDSLNSIILNNLHYGFNRDGEVRFLYCNDDEEQTFWKGNIKKYIHLYVYVLLTEWDKAWGGIEDRRRTYIESYRDQIEKEYRVFLAETDGIPAGIHRAIGPIMDTYLSKGKLQIPYLTSLHKNLSHLFTDEVYEKYKTLLRGFIKPLNIDGVNEHIKEFLYLCKNTDIIAERTECLEVILDKSGGNSAQTGSLTHKLQGLTKERCRLKTYKELVCFYVQHYTLYGGEEKLPICTQPEGLKFWETEGEKYQTALVFFTTKYWVENGAGNKCWLSILTSKEGEREKKLKDSMHSLRKRIYREYGELPTSIREEMGFGIEEYLWNEHGEVPELIKCENFPARLVEKYQKILFDKVFKKGGDFCINPLPSLKFCYALDSNFTFQDTNFKILLSKISPIRSRDINEYFKSIHYLEDYDDFGLTLLDFSKKHKDFYGISGATLDSFMYFLSVKSWQKAIAAKLGEDGKPFSKASFRGTDTYVKIQVLLFKEGVQVWEECLMKARATVELMKNSDTKNKRKSAGDKIEKRVEIIVDQRKQTIYNSIIPLFPKGLEENIKLYIKELSEEIESEGKKVPLTPEAYKFICDSYIRKYQDHPIPEYTFKQEIQLKKFGEQVASKWIDHVPFFTDEVKSDQTIIDSINEVEKIFYEKIWTCFQQNIDNWLDSYFA